MSLSHSIPSSLTRKEIKFLTELINRVYEFSEGNIWIDGYRRVNSKVLANIIDKEELIVAHIEDEVVGCIQLEKRSPEVYGFKMLVADPERRGEGIGSYLVNVMEKRAEELGAKQLQLELLIPTEFEHKDKVMLHSWYTRIGYELIATEDINAIHEGIGKFLKTNCKVEIYQKNL